MRSGEKEILHWFGPFVDTMLPLYDMDPWTLKKTV